MKKDEFSKEGIVGSLLGLVVGLKNFEGFFVEDKYYSSKFLEHWSVAKLRAVILNEKVRFAIRRK